MSKTLESTATVIKQHLPQDVIYKPEEPAMIDCQGISLRLSVEYCVNLKAYAVK